MRRYLRLIRIENLIIIVLTMYLMRLCIIRPQLHMYGLELQFGTFPFVLLVLSTVFITAAGYVINDYFDTSTDLLNRPGSVTIGRHISRRLAIFLHMTFNTLGVLCGIYISFYVKLPFLSVIFLLIPGILWFYSTTYKRQFLIGNLLVSLLTALVPFMVILFEIPLLIRKYNAEILSKNINLNGIIAWVGVFAVFAFFLTLIREIVKDVEDFEGDKAFGRNTFPIVLGVKGTKWILAGLILLAMALLVLVVLFYVPDWKTMIYAGLLIACPLILILFLLFRAREQVHYHRISSLLKGVMLAGILYSVLAWYIITYQIA